jgi:hypothetical protein
MKASRLPGAVTLGSEMTSSSNYRKTSRLEIAKQIAGFSVRL